MLSFLRGNLFYFENTSMIQNETQEMNLDNLDLPGLSESSELGNPDGGWNVFL